jgi:hypothetical protein
MNTIIFRLFCGAAQWKIPKLLKDANKIIWYFAVVLLFIAMYPVSDYFKIIKLTFTQIFI